MLDGPLQNHIHAWTLQSLGPNFRHLGDTLFTAQNQVVEWGMQGAGKLVKWIDDPKFGSFFMHQNYFYADRIQYLV